MKVCRAIVGGALTSSIVTLSACAASMPQHRLTVVNDVGKFEKFYAEATKEKLREPARWDLWEKDYNIAAVPPGPKRDSMARKLLNVAWPGYPGLMPKLPALSRKAETETRELFPRLVKLLGARNDSIRTRVVLYVGMFSQCLHRSRDERQALHGFHASSKLQFEGCSCP
jgi:hypothetical protein